MAYEGLKAWDAMFMLISGAGREVLWTNSGSYTNSKSLCDPSRREAHPFNVAYQRFADYIRQTFDHRELSIQIHSYDWNRHANHPSCQVSAGNGRSCPNLPIRDLSQSHLDMINAAPQVIHPAQSIGNNAEVRLNDYYGVNYNQYEFIYTDGMREFPVSNHVDLPGYSQNRQMVYTDNGWNNYDVFEPFFIWKWMSCQTVMSRPRRISTGFMAMTPSLRCGILTAFLCIPWHITPLDSAPENLC